jgi:hypothetical protein
MSLRSITISDLFSRDYLKTVPANRQNNLAGAVLFIMGAITKKRRLDIFSNMIEVSEKRIQTSL